jgi:hypothetical protein
VHDHQIKVRERVAHNPAAHKQLKIKVLGAGKNAARQQHLHHEAADQGKQDKHKLHNQASEHPISHKLHHTYHTTAQISHRANHGDGNLKLKNLTKEEKGMQART